ncbi:hypothetical protein [Saccharopolyspora hattusasensis]|uniref:hypothetical protein n=1 Tax=Saccharopolyspora hattusasensis TaxID=1128679 RepID=UPI003D99B0DA
MPAVPARTVCAWLYGDIDDDDVERALWAALAFDTRYVSLTEPPGGAVPFPAYAVLAPFMHGMSAAADHTLGARSWWGAQLRAGRSEPVLDDALRRARQAGYRPVARARFLARGADGPRLAAALLIPVHREGLPGLLASVARPLSADNAESRESEEDFHD